jgi:hypothetical protein
VEGDGKSDHRNDRDDDRAPTTAHAVS